MKILLLLILNFVFLAPAVADWLVVEKGRSQIWYDFEAHKAVLKINDDKKYLENSQNFSWHDSSSELRLMGDHIFFFWNLNDDEKRDFLSKTAKNFSKLEMMFNSAQAEVCSPGSINPGIDFAKNINWVTMKSVAKECSTQVLKQVYGHFLDQINSTYENIKDLATNPKSFFDKLISSFKNLDQVLIEGFKNFFELITNLASLGIETTRQLICQLLGDFTGQIAIGLTTGPAGLRSLGANLKSFFRRIERYKDLTNAMKADIRLQSSTVYYSHYLDKFKTHMKIFADRFNNPSELTGHFNKHVVRGKEFNFKTEQEYLDAAIKFSRSREGLGVESSSGFSKWNPKTGEFVSVSGDGKILTYYKVLNSKEYQDPIEIMARKVGYTGQSISARRLLPKDID